MQSPNENRSDNGKYNRRLVFLVENREKFELRDLLKSEAQVLESGSLGQSYKVILENVPCMIVKRFRDTMNILSKEDFEEHMRRLGRLSHPNLLPLVAYLKQSALDKLLVTDYMPNRSLAHFLHGRSVAHCDNHRMPTALDWSVRLRIVKGVAQALRYLYEEFPALNTPHGHLKSSNVLLSFSFQPLLSDYALVPVINRSYATCTMASFRSPESHQTGRPSKKSDVWCLGHLILEILTGLPTIQIDHTAHYPQCQVHDLSQWVASLPEEEWGEKAIDANLMRTVSGNSSLDTVKELMRIALACCQPDMERRLEMEEVVEMIEALETPEGAAITNKIFRIMEAPVEGGINKKFRIVATEDIGEWVHISLPGNLK
ncbi:hypothetical protein LUZ61_020217 [Rhynchospora tenuis]|uniref:Protein kinase domain-containing protein n=1 Tax=Rhynchospora tenuis TaxID=198213 RepID=A0AAD6ENL3_9POAL|nr:hypothetical protein LUZ61_020217 [Rhynchospora tenuis]